MIFNHLQNDTKTLKIERLNTSYLAEVMWDQMVPTFMPALSHFHCPTLSQTQELGQWLLYQDCAPCSVWSNSAKVMILSLNWPSPYSRIEFLKSYTFSTMDLDLCMEIPVKGQHSYLSFWLYNDGGIAAMRPKAEPAGHCTFAITINSCEVQKVGLALYRSMLIQQWWWQPMKLGK